MSDIITCPIVTKSVQNFQNNSSSFSYEVTVGHQKHTISFCRNCYKKIDFTKHKHILGGLLLNGKLDGVVIHHKAVKENNSHGDEDEFNFVEFIEQGDYPKTLKEKLDNLFLKWVNARSHEGELIKEVLTDDNMLWLKYYFKNAQEFLFYYDTLVHENYLENLKRAQQTAGTTEVMCKITFAGLNYAISIQEEGQNSKNCFVAMSFADTPEAKATRTAIKSAIAATGFIPVIVDEENIDSDKTINDKIIANLKKCKFCIADFTEQSKGVYFESGFALGQGKKVIYTCEKEDFAKAHFDIKPLQHIIYKTPEELKSRLIDKIEAWVK